MLTIAKFCRDFIAVESLVDTGPDKLLICVVPCIVHLEKLTPSESTSLVGMVVDSKLDFDPIGRFGFVGFRMV
jgi:hypothetical protein